MNNANPLKSERPSPPPIAKPAIIDRPPPARVSAPVRQPSELLDRNMPADTQAEQAVVGSMLLRPDVIDEVVLVVSADDFDDERNKITFTALVELRASNRKIDVALLYEYLKKTGRAAKQTVGPMLLDEHSPTAVSMLNLSDYLNGVPTAAHAVYYAQIVRDRATLRDAITVGTQMVRSAYQPEAVGMEVIGQAEQSILEITEHRAGRGNVSCAVNLVTEAMSRIDARRENQGITGLATGFIDLDAVLGGMRPSELLILAARPSMGKTALAMNIAEHAAINENIVTLFVSLEMAALELTDRMLCGRARVNISRARGGYIDRDESRRLVEACAEVSSPNLFVDDSPTLNMTEISATCRRMKRKNNLGLVVIDYLQLIQPDSHRDPRELQVSKIARRLKALARELKIPVLCLAQLNRQVEQGGDKRPKLSNLRESGAIEQDADIVAFIHREEYYDPRDDNKGVGEIIVGKNRNGPTGAVKVTWIPEFTRFENAAGGAVWGSVPASVVGGSGSGVEEFNPNDPRWSN